MIIRARFKIDDINRTHRHVGYEIGPDKKFDLSKPINENTATLNLSAVDPGPNKDHENSALWNGRAQGRVVLTSIPESVVEGLQGGMEVLIDMTPVPLPAVDASAQEATPVAPVVPHAPGIHEPVKAGAVE